MIRFLTRMGSFFVAHRVAFTALLAGGVYALSESVAWTLGVMGGVGVLEVVRGGSWTFSPVGAGGLSPETVQAAIDHLPGIFFVLDANRRLRYWNRDFTDVSGYTEAELYGQPALDLVEASHRRVVSEAIDEVLATGTAQVEADFRTEDGHYMPILFSGTSVRIDGDKYVVGTGTNILRRKTAETALREAEREYRLLAESISDVVTRHRPDGTRDYVSPSVEDLIGVPAYDLVGTHLFDRVHPDDVEAIKKAFEGARGSSTDARVEYRIRHADGHYVWVESNGRFTSLPDGTRQFVSVTRDISQQKAQEDALRASQKALQESQLLLEKTEEVATVGGWTYDPVDDAATWTAQVHEIFGVDADHDFSPGGLAQFFDEDVWMTLSRRNRRAIAVGVPYETEVPAHTASGETIWVRISCETDPVDESCYRVWGTVQDVTPRKEREAELRRAKEDADVARAEAERAERLKSLFLANMSHEIRTPLTSIIGFAEVLEEEVPAPFDRMARLVGRSGRRLLETISSVLDLSKLEAGKWTVEREPVDLRDVVTDAAELYAPRAASNDVTLDVNVPDTPATAFLDRTATDRIVDNLVGNAIKFTPPHGHIRVCVRRVDEAVSLVIEDDGPGIPEEMRDTLFEPFVHSPQEGPDEVEGSGLGLAITKRLVDELGGTIEVETGDGGTCFTICFPATDDASPRASRTLTLSG